MVSARGTTEEGGRLVILLGLEPENFRRVQNGEPIRVTPESNPVLRGLEFEIVITTSAELIAQMPVVGSGGH